MKPETLRVRHSAFTELTRWMQSKQAACNRAVQQATPEDLLVYFTQLWLPTHAGSMTADGELIAAAGSLSSTKSHLSSEFELLGCTGDWNPASQTGNPMLSVQIRSRRGTAIMPLSWATKRKGQYH